MARFFSKFVLPTLLSGLIATGFAFTQPPKPAETGKAADPAKTTDEKPKDAATVRKTNEENAKLFKEIARKLLELAVKLDKSDRPEDKDRAKTIRAALEVAEKAGVENQFRELLGGLGGKGNPDVQSLEKLIGKDEELAKTLLEMLTILMTDDESARLKAEIRTLEKFLKEAEEIKRRQELLRTKTDTKKGEPSKIGNEQKDLATQTKDLSERMGGNKSGGEAKPQESKSESKPTDSKDSDKASEPKPDSPNKSDSKEGDPKAGESKPSPDAKKPGETKPGEAKPGEAKPGEAKPGEAKPGEAKPGEAKPGEAKPGEAKPGEAKPGEAKPGESKPGDNKKPGETKPAIPGSGETKPGGEGSESKPSGSGKGDAKPSEGTGEGKGTTPPPAGAAPPPPGSGKSGGGSGGGNPPPPPPPPQNQTPGRKAVEEAYPHQKGAEDDANKDKRDDASKKMDKAVDALARAIEEMKKRLKQLREEEMLKLLANLEARCNRMLAMQIEVYDATKAIHQTIVKNDNQKTNSEIQKSQQQGDKEKEIIAEAEKTLKLLETEGSAVAFANVLQEVMGDMASVAVRLDKGYVETDTQAIEENIIAMLREMVAALKKQQQEMQNNKNNPPPPGQQKPNQKLIDQLAELKLIRALQNQVNLRTAMYGKKSETEQANDPIIQAELRQLSTRQTKLYDMIQKMATDANK